MDESTKSLLKLLNWLAAKVPPMAKFIERFTSAILDEETSAKETIEQAFDRSAPHVLPSQGTGSRATGEGHDRTTNRSFASDKKEEAIHHEAVRLGRQTQTDPELETSLASQEIALRQIERDFSEKTDRTQKRIDSLCKQENKLFSLMLLIACIGLVLLCIGAWFILVGQRPTIGSVSALLGLISGSGSAIPRRMRKEVRTTIQAIEQEQERQTHYLRVIQTTLALTGPERAKQLIETVTWLRSR
jgi:hypothetical protein